MDYHAIGLVESNSIAKGFEICDAMAKTANVTVLVAKSICPGKYIVMIGGDVAAVRQSGEAGGAAGTARRRRGPARCPPAARARPSWLGQPRRPGRRRPPGRNSR